MELMKNFQPYKTNILNFIFEGEPTKSIDAYAHCLAIMNGDHPSRASVINFLELLERSQYLKSDETRGKGGRYKIWSMAMTKEEAIRKLASDLNIEFTAKILSGLD